MNLFVALTSKVNSFFGQGSNPKKKNGPDLVSLKRKVLIGKKRDRQLVRQTNETIRVSIERGDLELRVIRNKKK